MAKEINLPGIERAMGVRGMNDTILYQRIGELGYWFGMGVGMWLTLGTTNIFRKWCIYMKKQTKPKGVEEFHFNRSNLFLSLALGMLGFAYGAASLAAGTKVSNEIIFVALLGLVWFIGGLLHFMQYELSRVMSYLPKYLDSKRIGPIALPLGMFLTIIDAFGFDSFLTLLGVDIISASKVKEKKRKT